MSATAPCTAICFAVYLSACLRDSFAPWVVKPEMTLDVQFLKSDPPVLNHLHAFPTPKLSTDTARLMALPMAHCTQLKVPVTIPLKPSTQSEIPSKMRLRPTELARPALKAQRARPPRTWPTPRRKHQNPPQWFFLGSSLTSKH